MRTLRTCRARRGVATLWVIVSLPAALCLLAVVIETGNLFLARVELLNAVEAAALAGADAWQDGAGAGSQAAARNRAAELAAANTVNGQPVVIDPNPGNAMCGVNPSIAANVVIVGTITGATPYTFHADATPPQNNRAVRVHGSAAVNSVLAEVCGITIGSFEVTAHATARPTGDEAELIRIGAVICP